jgi:hypothetical protein
MPLAIGLIVLGIAEIAFAVGLWQMASWGFWGILVLEVINIALTLLQGSFTGLVIPIIIVIYLWQKRTLFTAAPPAAM